MATTGRRHTAPAYDWVELAADNGLKHVALAHHDAWVSHGMWPQIVQRLPFMEEPETAGVARLVSHDPASASFVYATGTVWPLTEVIRMYADNGSAPGVKAGLEMCYLVGEALAEASEVGGPQGLDAHGHLTPWSIVLKGDGQPLLLGYGVPQVEMLGWREDPRIVLTEDSFRYTPPERLEGGAEDYASDLFSLALVGLEVMVGRPVYDGVLADVRQQATRGEGMRRLYQWRERLPQNVREVLGRALKPDPDTRFASGLEFVYAVHDLLGSIDVEGPSLTEVMAKVRASQKRGRALKGGQTKLLSRDELAELSADLQAFDAKPLPPPRVPRSEETEAADGSQPRWQAVRREGTSSNGMSSASSNGASTDGSAPEPGASLGRSLDGDRPRRRLRNSDVSPPPRPRPTPDSERGASGAGDATDVRRRLRADLARAEPPQPTVPLPVRPEDLEGPDDVELEQVDAAGSLRSGSAAAALLEKLRSSGERRRRLRSSPREPAVSGPETVSIVADPRPSSRRSVGADPSRADPVTHTISLAEEPDASTPVVAGEIHATPVSIARVAQPDTPTPAESRMLAVKSAADAEAVSVSVSFGDLSVDVVVAKDASVGAVALLAAVQLGGWPVDPLGHPVGGLRLTRGGAPVPRIETGVDYALTFVPAQTRLMTIEVDADPAIRLQTPVCLTIPIGWAVAGIGRLLGLQGLVAVSEGAPVDPDVLVLDVVAGGTKLVLRRPPE